MPRVNIAESGSHVAEVFYNVVAREQVSLHACE